MLLLIFVMVIVISCGGEGGPTGSEPDPEPTTGAVKVITNTSGDDVDDDGYEVTAGSQSSNVNASGNTVITGLSAGNVNVELSGIAGNCNVNGNNPGTVSIVAGDTTTTTFDVECEAVIKGQIAFASNRTGGTLQDYEIYLMNTNGASPQKITNNADFDAYPSISRDGLHIIYGKENTSSGNFALHIMDADGSDDKILVSSVEGSSVGYVTWSPDGEKILFNSQRDGNFDVYLANRDGTNQVNITDNDSLDVVGNHAWSPDGSKILFTSNRGAGTDNELYTSNTDGTGVIQLTDNEESELFGAWSPDGSQIAFMRTTNTGSNGLYVMNADGTGIRFLAETGTSFGAPTWSPDGSQIAFQRTINNSNTDVIKINADGSGSETNLTASSSFDGSPHWSPLEN